MVRSGKKQSLLPWVAVSTASIPYTGEHKIGNDKALMIEAITPYMPFVEFPGR